MKKKFFIFCTILCLIIILSVSIAGCFSSQQSTHQKYITILDEQFILAGGTQPRILIKVENITSSVITVMFSANLYHNDTGEVLDSTHSNSVTLNPGDVTTIICNFDYYAWYDRYDLYNYKVTKWTIY